ncbi:MAG: phytanoyl-CoA dioxygenase, partial [Hyphomicrobiales bacterium]|nr:phytanoyl-CoA dioxygenase [Hyphomicrobiales bacterium]
MDAQTLSSRRRDKVWLSPDSGGFEAFKAGVERTTDPADWPFAATIESNVPVYNGAAVRAAASDRDTRISLMAEWVEVFDTGPGIVVIKNAIPDTAVVDRATEIFEQIVDRQRRDGSGVGDHFAKPGANDRIWNALEKHCLADPGNFAR